jgi:hypothetical protein
MLFFFAIFVLLHLGKEQAVFYPTASFLLANLNTSLAL